jgi:two-component system, NarL family, sensor kinase
VKRFQIVGDLLINALARQRADRELRQSEMDLRDLAGRLIYAQEEERRRLARELHDDLSQRMALLAIEAESLQQSLTDFPASFRQQLQGIQDQLAEVSKDIHGLSRRLHPSILDTLGLANAIRSECRSFKQREGISVHFDAQPVPADIRKEITLCIYRIVQEGLRNIARHAHATEAHVSLSAEADVLHLCIQDDGIGFHPHLAKRRSGLGLASMDERVRLIQGTVMIESKPRKGTFISVRIPLGARPSLEIPSP